MLFWVILLQLQKLSATSWDPGDEEIFFTYTVLIPKTVALG